MRVGVRGQIVLRSGPHRPGPRKEAVRVARLLAVSNGPLRFSASSASFRGTGALYPSRSVGLRWPGPGVCSMGTGAQDIHWGSNA